MMPRLVLGREGMGEQGTEDDFDRWVDFVCDRIDEACGFEVDVDTCRRGESQKDRIEGEDSEREIIERATERLWDRWCAEGAP